MRFFDIVFSLAALLILSPILLFTAILLRLTGENEIFYFQRRVGIGGKSFSVIKFATMVKNSPQIGAGSITVKDDPRVLPVGRILRKTKINELPQLLNVLIGEMSFIGPRPHVERDLLGVDPEVKKITLSVRPGLSGIGSTVFRDEEVFLHSQSDPRKFYDEIIAPYKAALEVWYVKNQSYYTYFVLIALTVIAVLTKRHDLAFKIFKDLPPMPTPLHDNRSR